MGTAPFRSATSVPPVLFARDCVRWPPFSAPAPYQMEILRHIEEGKSRITVRGPHGLGKTALCAILVHWFALTRDGRDWKVVTTASVWNQLRFYLWPEIHNWARLLRWDIIGRQPYVENVELKRLELSLSSGMAFAATSNRSDQIEGAHADHIMYIFDESKIIPASIWDSVEGAMSTGKEKIWLAVSTPGECAGRFYEIHSRKAGYEDWYVRHVTKDEVISAGRMDPFWAEQRKAQWGPQSQLYINKVLGDFYCGGDASVIPLSHIELAQERWMEKYGRDPDKVPMENIVAIAIDVGRFGEDPTVFGYKNRDGDVVRIEVVQNQDTMFVANYAAQVMRQHPQSEIIIDSIGVGAGVYDRLMEIVRNDPALKHRQYSIYPFVASASTSWRDRSGYLEFADTRSAAWWNLRECLDEIEDKTILIPPLGELTEELNAPGFFYNTRDVIRVESKKDIYAKIGRSTNMADVVVMLAWDNAGGGIDFF